jgi:hypothetical protein
MSTWDAYTPRGIRAPEHYRGGRPEEGIGRYEANREISRERRVAAKPRKRVSKAQALVDYGIADNLAEARAMLRDMGE